jgi:hypothetical protein
MVDSPLLGSELREEFTETGCAAWAATGSWKWTCS